MACSPAASAPRTSHAPANCSRRQSFPSMPSRQSAPMLPSRKRRISAPAAAVAWSSSSGSNAVQRHTTEQARRRRQSGSTPHDLITADQRQLSDLYLLACSPPQPSSHSDAQFADSCTRNHLSLPTTRSLAPTCASSSYPKNISPTAAPSPHQHRRRAEISIALLLHRPPAAPQAHYLSMRFRALALFGRRPPERVVRPVPPASENLHNTCTIPDLSRCSKLSKPTRSPRRRWRVACPARSDPAP